MLARIFLIAILVFVVGCNFSASLEEGIEYTTTEVEVTGFSRSYEGCYLFNLLVAGLSATERIEEFVPWKIERREQGGKSFLKRVVVGGQSHVILSLSPKKFAEVQKEIDLLHKGVAPPDHSILSPQ